MTATLPADLGAPPVPPAGTTASSLCRLTFRTPTSTFELALPVDVPVAELLPAVLDLGGPDLVEQGLEHDGWVLQRLGEAPLDLEGTVGRHELLDGDVLHLRPRTDALPPVHYDDVVAGVADGIRAARPMWSPAAARATLLVAMGVGLLAGAVVLALPGPSLARAALAGLAGLLLLGAALSAAQAVGDRTVGAVFGVAGVAYLAAAAALIVTGDDPVGPRLLAAGVAALAASALATAAVAWAPPFAATGVVGIAIAVSGVVVLLGGDARAAAAVAVVLALVAGHVAPTLAFRLAGLRLPALPTTARELQQDIDPYPADVLAVRSRTAATLLDGVSAASGAVLLAAIVVLADSTTWPGWTLALVASVLLLVHQRGLASLVVRLAALVPGALGPVVVLVRFAARADDTQRLGVAVVAVLLAVAVAVVAASPARRPSPWWGRVADIVHTLSAAAVLPLAALVIGVYAALRGIGG